MCGARFSRSKYKEDEVVDDDDVSVEDTRRSGPTSLTQRIERSRNVRSLLRAVNKAAMRVNPTDPDAFLSLLSARAGHAEHLDDQPDLSDQAVQTDQPLPVLIDTGTPARVKQLQREMDDLKGQAHLTEMVTYAMLPLAAILMLLFAGKLWTIMHTGVNLAK